MSLLWSARMAWRDSRGSRTRLLVFMASLSLGVAALVSINSFGVNLERAIDAQAATLLGADLSLESDAPFTESALALVDSIGGDQSFQTAFTSMALFPANGATRLVSVRAAEGGYPYYGVLESSPPDAADSYLIDGSALIDGSLAAQTGAVVGDSLTIGNISYVIAGILTKVPRETAVFSALSPRVYIPRQKLDSSLLSYGSRAEYTVYFKLESTDGLDEWLEQNDERLEGLGLGYDTIAEEKENWSEVLSNIYRFLGLTGFIALLLGSLGIASAIYVYIRQRREIVALLRCLGADNRRATSIYLIQAVSMGLLGSLAGVLIGAGIQYFLPSLLGEFIPVEVSFGIVPSAMFVGLLTGLVVTTLFALIPLLDIRDVSPLEAIRTSSLSMPGKRRVDRYKLLVYFTGFAGVLAFSILQAPNALVGIGYVAGLIAVFGLLILSSKGVLSAARYLTKKTSRYTIKQSVANLQRPNNQTSIMMLAIGFGTFLIAAMFFIQNNLLNQIEVSDQGDRPNTILFDIQADQIEGVNELLADEGYPTVESVPMISMRIDAINGVNIVDMPDDETNWAHKRDYRSTYRSYLTEAETVLSGEFTGVHSVEGLAPVSMEEGLISELNINLGDTITFDVQGVPVETRVTSIREVDWQRVQTNFFFVFPEGVIDDAPRFYVAVTRVPSEEEAGALQNKIVTAYPNISVIDLRLILSVFEEIFGKISFVLRFMALFSMATGIIIVGGSVFVSRYYRIQETILLRTLGASTKQVYQVIAGEYLILGLLAAFVGVILALIASSLISIFVFETNVFVPVILILGTVAGVTLVTLIVGLFNSRGILSRPPLEILRREGI